MMMNHAVRLKNVLDALRPLEPAEINRRFKGLIDQVESLKHRTWFQWLVGRQRRDTADGGDRG
jgi:hypothetical protein